LTQVDVAVLSLNVFFSGLDIDVFVIGVSIWLFEQESAGWQTTVCCERKVTATRPVALFDLTRWTCVNMQRIQFIL